MSFKIGDMVRTKPMKITTISDIDRESPGRPENIFYQLENTSIHHADALQPITAPDAELVGVQAKLKDVDANLHVLMVASCDCGTKSPEIQWHTDECRYKRLGMLSDEVQAAITTLSTQPSVAEEVKVLREALKPFADAFELARKKYADRYGEHKEVGLANCDKMPDHWPMDGITFDMGTYRKARAALNLAKDCKDE